MPYTVRWKPSARKEVDSLDARMRNRVHDAVLRLAENPRGPGVKKLRGVDALYRLRVGDYRVIYTIEDRVLVVLVLKVRHRREAYDS